MGFSLVSHCTFVLNLVSSLNFHICHLASHHQNRVKARNGLRLAGDNTEGLGEEMDSDPKRAGHGAYWHHLPHCWTQASSATETPVLPVCVYVPVSCTCECTQACLCHLCVCVCVPVSGPLQTQRWRRQNMRCGATRRGGWRHPQTRGDWSENLRSAHFQDRSEERMASDNCPASASQTHK